jgi:hypothetical protein
MKYVMSFIEGFILGSLLVLGYEYLIAPMIGG